MNDLGSRSEDDAGKHALAHGEPVDQPEPGDVLDDVELAEYWRGKR